MVRTHAVCLNALLFDQIRILPLCACHASCESGPPSVTHEEFEDGYDGAGVNIHKIDEVVRTEEDIEDRIYVTTRRKLIPSKRGAMVYQQECLQCPWHAIQNRF